MTADSKKIKKLFLICPHCDLETQVRESFGSHVFFLTALGAKFDFGDPNFIDQLRYFSNIELVTEITLLYKRSCVFHSILIEKVPADFSLSARLVIKEVLGI